MEELLTAVAQRMNYGAFIILMMMGLYGLIIKTNLLKKIIALNIVQSAIILFFVSISAKQNATLPIIEHHVGHGPIHAELYINPLPHVLMLTAIVVAVATLGVALAMTIKIYKDYKTVEETEIISRIKAESLKEQTNQTVGRSFSGME